ncbi:hypothetical protein [Arthrobacter sulfonylureivorans]|uniref:Uncharacterized protein n=1 Tax=Arthrobacter sulfonylureivorans TaxID=2486855 RepID=A0ABY3W4J8_9MICC|nr:hypothetical protein [Arthrobacter sulfonylureivorans]UNK45129.1 hypothetical protein MNQ99_14450 [Arthrobacter sulfonylureivorans]
MSSKALEQGGKHDLLSLSSRLSATRQMLARKVRTAGLLFPLLTLAATAAFWSIVWLLDTTPVHALSPVNALLRIYGTGIAVIATMVIVGASLWLIAKRLGYADRFTGALFEHSDDIGPVPSTAGSLVQTAAAPAPVADFIFAALPAAPARLQLEAAPNDDGARPAFAVAAPAPLATSSPATVAEPGAPASTAIVEEPFLAEASVAEVSVEDAPARPLTKANPLQKAKGRKK